MSNVGVDYELETGDFTIQPSENNITFPLRVIEDEVAEGTQKFTWTLSQEAASTDFFDVQIADNDSGLEHATILSRSIILYVH